MAEVKINDLELLKFSQVAIYGKVHDGIGDTFPDDRYVCFGEYRPDGQALWAVSVYDFKRDHNCVLDVALNLNGLFSRELFEKMAKVTFNYTFVQANLLRVTAYVRVSNKRSQRVVNKWGFVEEGIVRKGFGPPNIEDMIAYGMLKTECKWI